MALLYTNYSNNGGSGSGSGGGGGGQVTMPKINYYNKPSGNGGVSGNNSQTFTRVMNAPINSGWSVASANQPSAIKQATDHDGFPVWLAQNLSDRLIAGLLYLKLNPTHLPSPTLAGGNGGAGVAVGTKGVLQQYYPHFDDVLFEGREDGLLVIYFHIHRVEGVGVINPNLRDFTRAQAAQRFSEWTGYPVKIVSDDARPYLGIRIVVTVKDKQQQQQQLQSQPLQPHAEVLSPLLSSSSSSSSSATTGRANLDAATAASNSNLPATPKKLPRRVDFWDYVDLSDIINKQDEFEYYLGLTLDGSLLRRSAYLLDHVLAAGAPNSGKSSFITSMVAHALYSEVRQPDRVRLVLVDRLGVTFNHALFEGLPQLYKRHVLTETEEILAMFNGLELIEAQRAKLFQDAKVQKLADFNRKMEQEKHPHLKQPIILVFIEESNELAESLKLRFTEPLKKIIKVCRKYGIYFINAGPSFKATTYDSDIIDCCTSKVVFGDFDSDTARVFNLGSLRLSEVVPGRGIFKVAGRAQEFQSLYLEEQTFMAVVNMLRQKAGIEVMDTSPDLAAIRSHLESSEFANSPFGIVSKEAGGAKETSPEQSIPPLGTKFHSETGVELGTFEAGTKFQVELSSNQSGTKFQPEWNSPPKSGTRLELMEQVPTQVELSSSPNEKFHAQNSENDESSSSTAITEVKLTHPQIAQIVAMLVDGKWNKTEMIKVIADLSKVHRGRNYKLLADYYEQLVASLGDWGGGGANSGELTLAKRKTQPVVGEIETRITAGATDPSFAPNTADAEKPLIQVTASPQVSSKESQQYQQPTVTLSNAVVSGVTTLNRPGPGSGTNTQGQDFTKATEALSPMIFPSTPLGAAETKEIAIPLGTASLTGLTLYIYQAMQASDPEYGFSLEELQSKLKDAYNLLIPLDTIGAKLNILMGLNKVEAEYDEESYETYYYLS